MKSAGRPSWIMAAPRTGMLRHRTLLSRDLAIWFKYLPPRPAPRPPALSPGELDPTAAAALRRLQTVLGFHPGNDLEDRGPRQSCSPWGSRPRRRPLPCIVEAVRVGRDNGGLGLHGGPILTGQSKLVFVVAPKLPLAVETPASSSRSWILTPARSASASTCSLSWRSPPSPATSTSTRIRNDVRSKRETTRRSLSGSLSSRTTLTESE